MPGSWLFVRARVPQENLGIHQVKKKIAAAAVLGALASSIAFAPSASAGDNQKYYYESSHSSPGDCSIVGNWGRQNELWSKYFCSTETWGWDLYIQK